MKNSFSQFPPIDFGFAVAACGSGLLYFLRSFAAAKYRMFLIVASGSTSLRVLHQS
jgi:hypothetical protein